MADNTGESHIDVQQRLEQWKLEATDPQHPNYGHADLDQPLGMYAAISGLLDKLRTAPESFTKQDAVTLFGTLNSGQRMKNKVADANPLPQLRENLLTLLYGEGTPGARIAAASRAIRFAAENMLGELYGWAHAEEVPLHNQCATNALAYLGYEFNPRDYDAFVAAHEQFKKVYQQYVGHIRLDLPLNLEIDKLYNVIDKVDLKERALGDPFDQLFADWHEAEWAFEELAEAAHRLGLTGPDDERAAFNVRRRADSYHLRLSYGVWLVLGFSGTAGRLRQVSLALLDDLIVLDPANREEFTMWKGDKQVSLCTYPIEAVQPLADELRAAYYATLDYAKERFSGRKVCLFRGANKPPVAQAVFDLSAREQLLRQGMPPQGIDTTESGDEAPTVTSDTDISNVPEPPMEAYPFTTASFELLEGIHASPTKEYYQSHKDEFKAHVEESFQRIFRQVAEHLRPQIKAVMETRTRLFGRFLKNDWGQGGAWDFYWGAFYPKGGKRVEDAQLSLWMDHRFLEYGFYIGAYGSEQRKRFQRNCQEHASALLEHLCDALPEATVAFGSHDEFGVSENGAVETAPSSWEAFLRDPASFDNDVSLIVPRQQLLATKERELVAQIVEAYEKLFPLVLMAVEDDPLPVVSRYLEAISPEPDEEAEPLEPYDRPAFLARTHLRPKQADDLYELLIDKRQIILYGPPGTGKTYVARELAKWVTGLADPPADRVEMIQFHPAYSYEDFIEGIRPESKPTEGGRFTVDYPPRPGVFRRFCTGAESNSDQPCVFVIDEINRGNIPRIFGELMLLLEYRDQDVALPYSDKRFQIPPNVYLIGTMNTADRSIALVDFALRRRFHFFHFGADPDLLERWLADNTPQVSYLAELYRRLSEEAIDDPDYAVGPSYFMDPNLTEQKLERIWQYSIEPYLEEYFVEQRARLNRWRWDSDFLKGIRGEQ